MQSESVNFIRLNKIGHSKKKVGEKNKPFFPIYPIMCKRYGMLVALGIAVQVLQRW